MRSLADRMRAYEQQKARLAETEAKLKEAERRARTRRLIEIGGLVEKASLSELSNEALFGALLSLRSGAGTAKQREQWAAVGSEALAEDAQACDSGAEPIVLTFPSAIDKDAASILRTNGFRYNKVLRHWEGLADFDDARALAASHGGTARKVLPPDAPDAPAAVSARVPALSEED